MPSQQQPPPGPSPASQQQQQQPPPPAPPPPPAAEETTPPPKPYNKFTHNAAIAMAVLGPIALLLPTRGSATKSTLQNALLGGAAFWGFNQLAEDYTGKSITTRSAERWGAMLGVSFPSFSFSSSSGGGAGQGKEEQDKENQKKKETESSTSTSFWLPTERAVRNKELMEAERRRRAEAEGRPYKGKDTRGLWERLWMGGEEEGWKEKRLEEERKALESGKGYSGLIMDQVREVWGGKDKSSREEGDGKGKGEGTKE